MNEKILVVEDDQTLQDTLAYNLKHQGNSVKTVEDSKNDIESACEIF
jgi:DNA-binding response OmpR family regulator